MSPTVPFLLAPRRARGVSLTVTHLPGFIPLPHGSSSRTARTASRYSLGFFLLVCSFGIAPAPSMAQEPEEQLSVAELKKLSVEELMGLQVTSVSRNEERLGSAAAAVSIVTAEDIRRSGVRNLPEVFRMVPGLHVARQSSSAWVVASRGFSSINSEKLLVLSDTRSIYTPLLSGVFWDVQDYILQDIERIEVIRGPGATLWGSNAVNGVVNITTKSARNTQGLFVETITGSEDHANVAARYGGRISDRAYYRVSGKYFNRDGTFAPRAASSDDWQSGRGGFRVDWDATASDAVTLQGDIYSGDIGQLAPSVSIVGREGPQGRLRVGISGGNLLGRWHRTMSRESDVQLRVYYDRTRREDPAFVDDLDTIDVDVQHRFAPARRHELTWGAAYRFTAHQNDGRVLFAVDPPSSRDHLVSGFVQDQIALPHSLRLTIGTKLEHNDFSGFELQPSGRVAWEAAAAHTVWGSVIRSRGCSGAANSGRRTSWPSKAATDGLRSRCSPRTWPCSITGTAGWHRSSSTTRFSTRRGSGRSFRCATRT
jgi:iron complex outermembrane recepter protein